jgi:predicted  nucleic acid-binding Zn-ribbon protein
MNDLKAVITSLESKIEKLVDLHRRTRKELTTLQSQHNTLTQTVSQQKQAIKELEERSKVLRLSKSISSTNENTTELKLKINELIREVDKCIALLNK